MALRARPSSRLRSDAGFGLIELMVAIGGTMIVFLAAVGFWEIASDNQADTGNRVEALAQQRAGLERMTRELRGARRIDFPSPGVVDFDAYKPVDVGSGQVQYGWRRVVYNCTQNAQCRRYEGPAGGTLEAGYEPLVCVPPTTPDSTPGEFSNLHDVTDCEVETASFTLDGDDHYLEIELRVVLPERDTPIALSDGVQLRNRVTEI